MEGEDRSSSQLPLGEFVHRDDEEVEQEQRPIEEEQTNTLPPADNTEETVVVEVVPPQTQTMEDQVMNAIVAEEEQPVEESESGELAVEEEAGQDEEVIEEDEEDDLLDEDDLEGENVGEEEGEKVKQEEEPPVPEVSRREPRQRKAKLQLWLQQYNETGGDEEELSEDSPSPRPPSVPPLPWHCPDCSVVENSRQDLECHVRVSHLRYFPFSCHCDPYARHPTVKAVRAHLLRAHQPRKRQPDKEHRVLWHLEPRLEAESELKLKIAEGNVDALLQERRQNAPSPPPGDGEPRPAAGAPRHGGSRRRHQRERAYQQRATSRRQGRRRTSSPAGGSRKARVTYCRLCQGNVRGSKANHVYRQHLRKPLFRCSQCRFGSKMHSSAIYHTEHVHAGNEASVIDDRATLKVEFSRLHQECFEPIVRKKKTTPAVVAADNAAASTGTLRCLKCETAVTKGHAEEHVYKHMELKPYRCSACDYSAERLDKVKGHVKETHKEKSDAAVALDESKESQEVFEKNFADCFGKELLASVPAPAEESS